MEINLPQWKMDFTLTVKYKIYKIIREMLDSLSCLIILVKIHAISRKLFLNELTYNLVMSRGAVVGFSKNFGKRSNSLSCFFKNCLQLYPLKVGVASRSLNIFQNT